jgi:chloride channel protein, CIC family
LGVGYDYVDRVLTGDFPIKVVALLAVMKLIATPTCYSSGNAGGIFGPSLFIGAMIGGTVGSIAHTLLPGLTANPGAYALVGMGTAFAGIVRTPLTSVIMIFEMTRDYSIIVPLMISNLISFFISQQLQREPIYEALALQEGVYLPTGESREELAGIPVGNVMQAGVEMLSSGLDVAGAKQRFDKERVHSWPFGDRDYLQGVVSSHEIETAQPPPAAMRDLIKPNGEYPYVHSDHPLSYALERMGATGVDVVPVVSRANIHQMYGVVTLSGILATYGVPAPAAAGLK